MAKQSEYAEQKTLFDWAKEQGIYELLDYHASLNGELVTPGQRIKAINKGLRPGIPDTFLPVPIDPYHGLWIEMKRIGETLEDDQRLVINKLIKRGYAVEVCFTWFEGRDCITLYLEGNHAQRGNF